MHHAGDAQHEDQRRDQADLPADQFAEEAGRVRRVPGARRGRPVGRSSPSRARPPTAAPAGTPPHRAGRQARAPAAAARAASTASTSSHSAMPNQSSAAVYLLAIARPANRPIASHHRAFAAARAAAPAPRGTPVQKNSSGVSGVIITRADAEQQRRVQQRGGAQPGAPAGQQAIRRHPPAAARRPRPKAGPAAGRPAALSPASERAEADPQRDHRRMVGIAGRQGARPDPVIGLVRRQRDRCGDDQAQQCQRDERGQRPACDDRPHRARQTSVAETA